GPWRDAFRPVRQRQPVRPAPQPGPGARRARRAGGTNRERRPCDAFRAARARRPQGALQGCLRQSPVGEDGVRRPSATAMIWDVAISLMLATLSDRREFGDDWLLERKFDGVRCVARKDGDDVRLESRTGKHLTGTYPE